VRRRDVTGGGATVLSAAPPQLVRSRSRTDAASKFAGTGRARKFRQAMRVSFKAVALLAACALTVAPAGANNRHLEVPAEEEAEHAPAYEYANMSDDEAVTQLSRRRVPFERVLPAPAGVRVAVRLLGPLHGVAIHSTLPPEKRSTSAFEIMDARLALTLDDFCRLLAMHDVVELVHFTIYRPADARPKAGNTPQTRHPGGMAIDVGAVRKSRGQWLSVKEHWSPAIGATTCGEGARRVETEQGRELVSLVCEAADRRLFHYMLTPHFNAAHADHLHLEIKPAVKWFLVN
jgi:hypothetical protein